MLIHTGQELPVPASQLGQDLAEGNAVGLIAGVDLPEQRDVEVGRDHQGQADHAEVGPFALGMAALGQAGPGLRGDEGVGVGGIEGGGLWGEAIAIDEPAAEILFGAVEGLGLAVSAVGPEAVGGSGGGWRGGWGAWAAGEGG